MVQEIISQGPIRLALYPNYQPAYGGGSGMYGAPQMGGYGVPAAGAYYGQAASQMGGYSAGGYGAGQQGSYYGGAQQAQGSYGGGAYGGVAQGGYQQTTGKAAGGSPWSEHKTDDGISYWYNASTGVSQVKFYLNFEYKYVFLRDMFM